MTTATELLQSIADAWAQSLGGKIPVQLNLLVYAGPNASKPHFGAYIGGAIEDRWNGYGPTADAAIENADRKWKLDGSPSGARDIEKAKLRAKAAELGLKIVEDTEPLIDPVKDL